MEELSKENKIFTKIVTKKTTENRIIYNYPGKIKGLKVVMN
jgi:hypothetical protein